ncbi:Gfo/Idh/MocA family protein [Phenylobacterium deserti]|uniref:Glucose-fructose oxidoreductase n=1 Tax=Phenylobacterium deserti TaxID=1914756 RepID=A0A328ARF1_9CAUL|nr:Gfo/Idh/MocA family oxidoreductase [Phenylobacterium deserti]RAK56885.1 glucose-fructose oxidoreductase [Phenylobacterium deserti]
MTDGSRLNRRGLILGAGAGLAASVLSPQALAQAAGRKIGYAIVGLGSYATRQIMPQFVNSERSRLTALVSGSPEKARTLAAQYGIPERSIYSYQTFDRIADNPDVDVVYVILPNSMHAEYSIRAAKAGKHVMCEKPMAPTVRECEQMIAACRQANRKLMIGYRSRFQAHNVEAIRMARGGEMGPTRVILAEHGFNIGDPTQWRLKRSLAGGGALMDIGIYSLNATRYLTGEEPIEVTAIEKTDRSDIRFREVDDTILFALKFPSGAVANCVSSYTSNHNRYRVVQQNGWFELEPATAYTGQQMRVAPRGQPAQPREIALGKNQFAGQLDHMAECILTNREPIVSGEEGLRDVRVMEAIYRSVRESRAVKLT